MHALGPICADGITAADSFFVADAPDAMPYGVFVAVEIKPEHVGEFKRVMAIDVAGSRKEERCRRFDLMQVDGSETKFCFYEVYEDEAVTRTARDAARASCTRRPPSQRGARCVGALLPLARPPSIPAQSCWRRRSRITRRSITTRRGRTSRRRTPRPW